jgi:hypothetical protein
VAEPNVNINVDSPQVDAPVEIKFGSLFEGLKASIDGIVDDVQSGSSVALTGLFLAVMFVVAGVYVWRRV